MIDKELIQRVDDLEQRLANLVRVGVVSSVNAAAGTARVAFGDRGVVSAELPVLVRQTLQNRDYGLPDVGEHVACVFLPTGVEAGFVVGALYSRANPPTDGAADKRRVVFGDGAAVEYDRAAHALTITLPGGGAATLTAPGGLTINADVTLAGNIAQTGSQEVSGDVVASGISLASHTHTEQGDGAPTSGPQ